MFIVVDKDTMETYLDEPTYGQIVGILQDAPVVVQLPDTKDMVGGEIIALVSDDMTGREHRGEIHRQVEGSTLLWSFGAERKPYAGPIVLTGVHTSIISGLEPISLSTASAFALHAVLEDIHAVLHGGEAHPSLPDHFRAQFRDDAAKIADMPHEGSIWKEAEQ